MTAASLRRVTRALLACGIVGPPLFIATFLVEGATRPGYSAWRHFVSQLATGDGGWVQVVNFLVLGTLSLAFAIGLARMRITSVAIVLGVFALGILSAGIFVTDPALGYPPGADQTRTTHGTIHGVAGLVSFTSNAIACFVAAWHFRGDPAWRGFVRYSVITGILVLALFVASTAVSVADELGAMPNGPTGLIQRLSIVISFGWIALLAYRLRRQTPAGS